MSAEAFKVAIPQATLDDLRDRLGHTRWPDEITGADGRRGDMVAGMQCSRAGAGARDKS